MTSLLLHNAVLVDGTGAPPVPDAAVVVEGDRICWAGPVSDAPETPDAVRIDLGGHTICPASSTATSISGCQARKAAPWRRH